MKTTDCKKAKLQCELFENGQSFQHNGKNKRLAKTQTTMGRFGKRAGKKPAEKRWSFTENGKNKSVAKTDDRQTICTYD